MIKTYCTQAKQRFVSFLVVRVKNPRASAIYLQHKLSVEMRLTREPCGDTYMTPQKAFSYLDKQALPL